MNYHDYMLIDIFDFGYFFECRKCYAEVVLFENDFYGTPNAGMLLVFNYKLSTKHETIICPFSEDEHKLHKLLK